MTRMVNCIVLKREAPGLEKPPYPGELGQTPQTAPYPARWTLHEQHRGFASRHQHHGVLHLAHRAFAFGRR